MEKNSYDKTVVEDGDDAWKSLGEVLEVVCERVRYDVYNCPGKEQGEDEQLKLGFYD